MVTSEREGVVKYHLTFEEADLNCPEALISELNVQRKVMMRQGLVGADPSRYAGLGYGNLSVRMPSEVLDAPCQFLMTGTQTGHLPLLTDRDLACVESFDLLGNCVTARGRARPSSEAMTHGALYQSHPKIMAVIHVHSTRIWRHARALGIVGIERDIAYGTAEMATAVGGLIDTIFRPDEPLVLSMTGHQDGIVAAGCSLASCSNALLALEKLATQIIE